MNATTLPKTADVLYRLAPSRLTNFRVRRYHGDDLCLPVTAFTEDDQARLRRLYEYLMQLQTILAPDRQPAVPRLIEFLQRESVDKITDVAISFGRESFAAQPSPLMAKTVHDLRGGGLTPLLGQLQLAAYVPPEEPAAEALHFLTRDHLKIMRNALLGLDDAKREEDLLPKIHGTDFIVQKWQGATLHGSGRAIRLDVDCPQPAAISECCVEFGALDRILYNLINNACRHAVGEAIRLVLLPVPDAEGKDLRFVLINEISAPDFEHLRELNLGTLFQEETSTTGSGYGLAIATDFVSHAYGLKSPVQAIEGGYLGATLLGHSFAAWFHWPRVVED